MRRLPCCGCSQELGTARQEAVGGHGRRQHLHRRGRRQRQQRGEDDQAAHRPGAHAGSGRQPGAACAACAALHCPPTSLPPSIYAPFMREKGREASHHACCSRPAPGLLIRTGLRHIHEAFGSCRSVCFVPHAASTGLRHGLQLWAKRQGQVRAACSSHSVWPLCAQRAGDAWPRRCGRAAATRPSSRTTRPATPRCARWATRAAGSSRCWCAAGTCGLSPLPRTKASRCERGRARASGPHGGEGGVHGRPPGPRCRSGCAPSSPWHGMAWAHAAHHSAPLAG